MIAIIEVRCDLQEDRLLRADFVNRRKQFAELAFLLESAKAGRVRRADVDRQVASNWRHPAHAERIVRDSIGTVLVRADVHADHTV